MKLIRTELEYENVKLQNHPQVSSHAQSTSNSIHHCAPQLAHEATRFSKLLLNTLFHHGDHLHCFSPGTSMRLWMNAQ